MAFNEIKKAVEEFKNSDDNILFIHIREPEEIKRAVEAFNAITLLIKREGLNNIFLNYSDANVNNYNYDYIIRNTTLEEFEIEAEKFVEKVLEKAI